MSNELKVKSLFQFNEEAKLIHSLETETNNHVLTYSLFGTPVTYRAFTSAKEADACFLEVVKMYVTESNSAKIVRYMATVKFKDSELKEHLYKVVTIANFFIKKALEDNMYLTLRQLNDLMYLSLGFTSITGNLLFNSSFQKSTTTFRLAELELLMLSDDKCFAKMETHIVPRFVKIIEVGRPEKITESIHFLLEDMYRYYTNPMFRTKINDLYFNERSKFMNYDLDSIIHYEDIRNYFLDNAKGFNHVRINNEKDC
jgi:hypothetical protein